MDIEYRVARQGAPGVWVYPDSGHRDLDAAAHLAMIKNTKDPIKDWVVVGVLTDVVVDQFGTRKSFLEPVDPSILSSRGAVTARLEAAAQQMFEDPVVEVQHIDPGNFRIRVGRGERGPRYFAVKVSEQVGS